MGVKQVDIQRPMDVIRLVNGGGLKGRSSLLITLIALGGVFVDAYDFSSLGIGAVQLKEQLHLSAWQLGLVSSAMAFSAFFGALWGGYFVDRIGRLKMFLLDLYFFVISALGAAFSTNLDMLIFFRLMMGLGAGLDFPVALSFVAEYNPLKQKGKFVNLSYTNWYIAAIVGYLFTYLVYNLGAGANLWRYAVGFGAVPALIILVLRFRYMEESPMWAAHRGGLQAAARILQNTHGIQANVAAVGEKQTTSYTLRDFLTIFSPRYRMRTVLASTIAFTQSIEYFAVVFYLPTISQMLFGKSLVFAILGGMFFSAFGLLGAFVQAFICDRTGIRRLALVGYVVATASLIGIGVAAMYHLLALAAVFVASFLVGHTVGPGPQGMAMGTLSYPTVIRGAGVGWTQAMLRVGSIIGSFFFPMLLAVVGFHLTFILLAAAPFVGWVVTMMIRWEPIGRDIEQEAVGDAPAVGLLEPVEVR